MNSNEKNSLPMDIAFAEAMRTLPEVPDIDVLAFLSEAAISVVNDARSIKSKGLELQRRFGLEAVPPKAEYEWAAGLWSVIRSAVIAEKEKAGGNK